MCRTSGTTWKTRKTWTAEPAVHGGKHSEREDSLWPSRSSATTVSMSSLARRAARAAASALEHQPLPAPAGASLLAGRYTIGKCLGTWTAGHYASAIDGKEMRRVTIKEVHNLD